MRTRSGQQPPPAQPYTPPPQHYPAPSAPTPAYYAAQPTPPPTKTRRTYGLGPLLGSALIALAAGIGIGWAAFHKTDAKTATPPAAAVGTTAAGATFMLSGTFTLQLGAFENDGATCKGYTGYTDIDAGTPVTVADQAGQTIAVGQLDSGTPQGTAERATSCVLAFNIQVPDGKPFYAVTVSHRGTQTYSPGQARQPIALTLGNP